MSTTEDQIKKMYSAQLDAQKEQLKQNYTQADAEYTAEKEKAQKTTDANLTRTAVEAQKAAVNNAELHDAYGLSSGTRAQARLAQENQLQSDLTALRVQQQELDADVERQRTLLSQQYQSAIQEAQAENDLALAEALYAEAKAQEEALLAQQQAQNELALEYAKLEAEQQAEERAAQDKLDLEYAQMAAKNGDTGPLLRYYANRGVTLSDEDLAVITGGAKSEKVASTENYNRFLSAIRGSISSFGQGNSGSAGTQSATSDPKVTQATMDSVGALGISDPTVLAQKVAAGEVVEIIDTNGQLIFLPSSDAAAKRVTSGTNGPNMSIWSK